ncbi:MAG: iron-containing alcohol dehydrogenase [Promethearchaeota archaeon]
MASLKTIEYSIPTKIIFGAETVDRIGELVYEYTDKVFLITNGKVMRKIGLLDRITGILEKSSVEYILYDEVERDPSNDIIDEIGTLVKQSRVKIVIGLGGTSVINTTKAVSYLAKNEGKIEYYLNGEL